MDEQTVARWQRQWRRLRKKLLGETHSLLTSLSLASEPPAYVPCNCIASYKFPAFEHLKAWWDRVLESVLIA
jgi:hypothetical protein